MGKLCSKSNMGTVLSRRIMPLWLPLSNALKKFGRERNRSMIYYSMSLSRCHGFLSPEDIYNLNLPVDLVVLSACETALGKQIDGEGLVGLTRGFMYAGATRVVASLWKMDDVASAELMARFYREMGEKQ
jgi:CHAT domain-containing protein